VIFSKQSGRTPTVVEAGRELGGIDVLGFFTAEHGVGEAARVLASTLRAAEIPVSTIDYTDTQSRRQHAFEVDNESKHRVLLCSLNAEQLTVARDRLGKSFFC
jgi:acetate kinase